MKKILASLIFLFSVSLSLAQKGKSYYLIDLDEKALNAYDKNLLDSLLPLYHKSNNDTLKLMALKYFANGLSDEKVWMKYNSLLFNLTDGKTDVLSIKFHADAFNNKGYISQYFKNNLDSAIIYYNNSLDLSMRVNHIEGIGIALNNLAFIYQHQGDLEKCIDLYSQADLLFTKNNYYDGLISVNINLGDIYFNNDDYGKAEECFKKALTLSQKTKTSMALGNVYNQLGTIYRHKKNYSQSLQYYSKAVEILKTQSNYSLLSLTYSSIGWDYVELKDLKNAAINCELALKTVQTVNDPSTKSTVFDFATHYYLSFNDEASAKIYLDSAYYYAKKVGYPELIYKSAIKLSSYYKSKKDYEQAFHYLTEARQMNDSINNDNIKKSILKQEFKSDFEKKEIQLKAEQDKKDTEARAEKKRQQYILFAVILALVAMLIVVYVVYRNYASKKKSALLLEEKNKIIYTQKQEVEVKQKEIIDSINYAQKIQTAVLTSEEVWKKISPEHFIIFFPKDIVSGDFYWAYNTLNNRSIFALADCTGHGVPGGFMSMLGNSFLNELIVENKLFKADTVLNKLRDKIIKALGQKGAEDRKDGMDMGLCVWNKLENTLEFSGANNSLWLIRNNELIQYQGDKMPIGQFSEELKPFTAHNIELQKNDLIVLCTDGFADQFGGDGGKKLKSKNLKEFLVKGSNNSLAQQKTDLVALFNEWKGNHQQVDDVSMIMLKVV
jgi:serine phosphatase RsbU (regulator of sigma subunit)/tetratricopeptide (TPR) repeat protein